MTLNDSDSETTPALHEEIKASVNTMEDTKEEIKEAVEKFKHPIPLGPPPPKEEIKDHDDYNSGLCDDMLRVCVSIFTKVSYSHWTSYNKERKTFNRLIHVRRSHTLKDLHMEIFKYFRPLFELWYGSKREERTRVDGENEDKKGNIEEDKANDGFDSPEIKNRQDGMDEAAQSRGNADGIEDNKNWTVPEDKEASGKMEDVASNKEELERVRELPDGELFELIFPGVTEENWEQKLKQPNDYPYELRFINFENRYGFNREKCPYCDSNRCENCLVPYTSTSKLQSLLDKFSKSLKNDYYYYPHSYSSFDKKELELEVIFNENPEHWHVDLNRLNAVEHSEELTKSHDGTRVSIYSCFDQFSSWETLDKHNAWYCITCKDFVQASKRMEILRCPPMLVLHLKRFKMREDVTSYRAGGRLSALVEFPLNGLDLRGFVSQKNAVYDLYAVSNHYGSTDFGHYTAFAMNKGEWYKFDDSSVYKVDKSQICSTAAYVLFYKRRDINDNMSYNELRQSIPSWHKVPVVEAESNKSKAVEKTIDGEMRQMDGGENKVEDGIGETSKNLGQLNI
eukprot:TRINITY_DN4801_c0_g5_i1.p1 TRINITY_DN4801_c0_g5~~TRINITY_DN4801_c0_g5_i1.p1  ORF type:complete len:567 (-),score=114.62 TRINITY_DN4801_c0_g5_i1:85-1785(-)